MRRVNCKRVSVPVAMLVALAGCGGSSGGGGGASVETLGLVTDDNATEIALAAYRNLLVMPLLPQQMDQVAETVVLSETGMETGSFPCEISGQVERRGVTSDRYDERLSADACRFETDDFDIRAQFILERGFDRDWPEFALAFPPGPGMEAEGVQDYHALRTPMTLNEVRFTDDLAFDSELRGSITRRFGMLAPDTYPAEGEDYRFRWEYEARDTRISQATTAAGEDEPSQQVGIDLGRHARMVANQVFDIQDNGSPTLTTRAAQIGIEGRIRIDDAGLFDINGPELVFDLSPGTPPSFDTVRLQPDFLGLGSIFGVRCPSIGVIDVTGADNTGMRIVFTAGASQAVFAQVFTTEATRTLRFASCSDFLDMDPMD
ncbi:hypothetical protein [Isoalcanivorax indicus]|uniref:hypothetical protein n=1 Tax=Isoalcanivorax indicus TaxID=2202653 RepID=UPI0013C52102|nr:hypothetical protein [Isoalcanivorax indicus]